MRSAFFLLLLAFTDNSHAGEPPVAPSWEFGLSLASTSDGQLFSLFVVKMFENEVIESSPLSRPVFVKQAQGRAFSPANPEGEDLFRKFGVVQCTLPPDSAAMGFLTDCGTLDNLWRLRFWEYPLQTQEGQQERTGWSEDKLKPSTRQMMLLSSYGLEYPTGLIHGESVFRLLRDMGDPEWVANYRGAQ